MSNPKRGMLNATRRRSPDLMENLLKRLACLAAASLFWVAFGPRAFAQQPDEVTQLLQTLADAPGPPGFEEAVRQIMVGRMKPFADRITYDGLGSVIAVQGTTGPRVMVDAHMDELGGMIRRITPRGLLTMQMLGGWLDQIGRASCRERGE